MKKAAIFSQTWEYLGGGERYAASVADVLSKNGYTVDIWWPQDLTDQIHNRFSINLSNVKFVDYSPLTASFLNRVIHTTRYDVIFWVSDGSLPISLAKKTIIHFQIPLHGSLAGTLQNKIKAALYASVCNSNFTKSIVDTTYSVNSQVLYPPVNTDLFQPLSPKKNIIVSLGRFSRILHSKRQDTLIKAFIKLSPKLPDWKLVLAGGSLDDEYVNELKKLSKNYPVEIITNPDNQTTSKLLGTAKIFWSATGFNINEKESPEKVEHFGITVVEAMSAGCVPIVTNAGGHKETVVEGKSGFLWDSIDDLVTLTTRLATQAKELTKMSKYALERSQQFSPDIFNENFLQLLA